MRVSQHGVRSHRVSHFTLVYVFTHLHVTTVDEDARMSSTKHTAFRDEIYNTAHRQRFNEIYKLNADCVWVATCESCGTTTQCDLDHGETPFVDLLTSFLSEKYLQLDNVVVVKHGIQWRLKDVSLARSWREYYDSLVQYQPLCKACHHKKSANDIKRRS